MGPELGFEVIIYEGGKIREYKEWCVREEHPVS
jgi:hypothetical protein